MRRITRRFGKWRRATYPGSRDLEPPKIHTDVVESESDDAFTTPVPEFGPETRTESG